MNFLMRVLQILAGFLIVAVVVGALGFMALKPQLDHRLHAWAKGTKGKNFEIQFLDYGKSELSGQGFALEGVRVQGVTRIQYPFFEPREFQMKAKKVRIYISGIRFDGMDVRFQVNGFNASGGRLLNEEDDERERIESVSQMDFTTTVSLSGFPTGWFDQILKRAHEFRAWIFNDQPINHLSMQGRVVFLVDGWPISVRIQSVENEKGEVTLQGNPEDLRVIAEMIEPKFTESDLNVAAKNLIKMPKLLHIRREAEMKSIKLDKRDPGVSYDTFRHIFWSYWLTKAYGADFARETTNAHEIGDLLNTPEESDKDRHHNALGIDYAERNLTEDEVEKMIFEDPRVIRLLVKPKANPAPPKPAKKPAAPEKKVESQPVILP